MKKINYQKLFIKLYKKNMVINDLTMILSSRTIAKLRKGENLNTDTLIKICEFLKCDLDEIMELEKD